MKKLVLIGSIIVGGVVTGFTQVDAPKEAKAEAPTKEEINEMVEDYPLNTMFTQKMSDKMSAYYNSIEKNEAPTPDDALKDDPTVTAAVATYTAEDEATQKEIRFMLQSSDLIHFNTYEQGVYPQELLDQSVERDVRILQSVQSLSDNVPLNKLIDETIEGISGAADGYTYLEAWSKLDVFNYIIGELSRPKPIGEENEKPTYEINSYQIEKTEYATLGSFVKDIKDCFAEDSEYRSIQDDTSAESALANSVLHYVNYFESDIEKAGLTEAFDAWQQTAHEILKVHGTEAASNHEELAKTFENQMNSILSNL